MEMTLIELTLSTAIKEAGEYGDVRLLKEDAEYILAMLKKSKNEYENGFNDAMLGKQELMYEGIDGKWCRKDW